MNTAKHENRNYVNDPHVCFLPLKMASLATHFALLSYDVNCIRSMGNTMGTYTRYIINANYLFMFTLS